MIVKCAFCPARKKRDMKEYLNLKSRVTLVVMDDEASDFHLFVEMLGGVNLNKAGINLRLFSIQRTYRINERATE